MCINASTGSAAHVYRCIAPLGVGVINFICSNRANVLLSNERVKYDWQPPLHWKFIFDLKCSASDWNCKKRSFYRRLNPLGTALSRHLQRSFTYAKFLKFSRSKARHICQGFRRYMNTFLLERLTNIETDVWFIRFHLIIISIWT